jgi:hypothetical protein
MDTPLGSLKKFLSPNKDEYNESADASSSSSADVSSSPSPSPSPSKSNDDIQSSSSPTNNGSKEKGFLANVFEPAAATAATVAAATSGNRRMLFYFLLVGILIVLAYVVYKFIFQKGGKGAGSGGNALLSVFGFGNDKAKQQVVKPTASTVPSTAKVTSINELEEHQTGDTTQDGDHSTTLTAPEPDDSSSPTQTNQSSYKGLAGYCFIGEDRGFRSCTKVGEDDKCMSGNIFPTKELCINPTLRSN